MKDIRREMFTGFSLLVIFIIYTISLKFIDVKALGVLGTSIGYSRLNIFIHNFFGVHMKIYNITDWAGIVPIIISIGFGFLGLFQLIHRKSILKVDKNILVLGIFYLIVFGTYVFFEKYIINYRPILIGGKLEPSYPSSTTLLSMCIMLSAKIELNCLIHNTRLNKIINFFCLIFTSFMVIGRLISGVHWFTDIVGGLIFSAGMIIIYDSTTKVFGQSSMKS